MQQPDSESSSLQNQRDIRAGVRFHPEMLVWSEAAHWMIDLLHADGKRCPHCGVEITDEARVQRWYQGARIKCSSPECGRFYTSTTNTELSGSTLDARELYLLKCLLEWGVAVDTIITIVPVNKETVRRWEKRFQAMESAGA